MSTILMYLSEPTINSLSESGYQAIEKILSVILGKDVLA